MSIKLSEIARYVNAEMLGEDVDVKGVCGVDECFEGCLTWAQDIKKLEKAYNSCAIAIIISFENKPLQKNKKPILLAENPKLAFAKASFLFTPKHKLSGINEKAIISPSAQLGKDAAIGHNVIISDNTKIGDNAKIYPFCYIGEDCQIGDNVILYPNVIIMDKIIIGSNVIIHSGTVIGADGFGYVKDGTKHVKIPQTGTVLIGDDVEIGSNTCVDRATTTSTKIGRGTKIDNLVHIAHNVEIGEDCIIVAMTGIAGSSKIGSRSILAAKVGVTQHIEIGSDTIVLAKAGVTKSISSNMIVSGFPAQNHKDELKYQSFLSLLPKTIESLKKRIEELEK